ncbi:selenocysteine insertion sequence-binding protein 2 [Toxorhynchites rutilus septentrionalis]|uniref:selenocysteine insertion sequence-binding protein 2 n=1 Tax=Toxorhynchites rutilus septentrionalis TaxID=329112 RepID=UPI0024795B5F|nr:selenocysteine insertion sequence-binding protein 2 [Toxorhynchites rutilus septentrionalis]
MSQNADSTLLAQAVISAGPSRSTVQVPLSDLEKSSARKARKEAEKERKQAKRYEEQLKKIRGPKSQKIQIIDESFLEKYNNAQTLPSGPSLKTKKRSKKTPSDVVQINLSDCIRDRLSLSEKAENGPLGETKTILKPVVPIAVTQPIVLHKGKQREVPKDKKLTKLKKDIISNRKLKQETNNSEDGQPIQDVNYELIRMNGHSSGITEQVFQQNVAVSPFLKAIERCCANENTLPPIVGSEEYQNGFPALHDTVKSVDKVNHSRTFRTYCDHFVTDDLRSQTETLVTKLFQFQTSAYGKNPIKAVSNKRYCVGFNEVLKYLETHKLKLVLIAPDLEPNDSIDQLVARVKAMCRQTKVPYVFGVKRRKLGFHLMKKVPVSCLGVLSYSGADETVKQILEITEQERVNYRNATV